MAGHPTVSLPGYRVFRRGDGAPWLAWRGTLGPVYKAEETASGRVCALTAFHRGLLPNAAAAEHARHEVERLRGLRHPNFTRPLDLVQDARGDSFLVSEWSAGWPLVDFLRQRQALNRADLLAVLRQAATANEFAVRHRFLGIELAPDQIWVQIAAPLFSEEEPPPEGPLEGRAGLAVKFNALPIEPAVRSRPEAGETINWTTDPGAQGPSPAGASLMPLVYELLGRPARGLRGVPARFAPFPILNEAANDVLREEAATPHHGTGSSEAFFGALARALGVDPAAVADAPPLPEEPPAPAPLPTVAPPPVPAPAPPPVTTPVPAPAPKARATGQNQIEFSEAVIQAWRLAASGAAEGGCRWIEMAHLVTAFCQLDFLAQRKPGLPDIAREADALAEVLARFELTTGGMRQAAQRQLVQNPPERVSGERTRISRSLASKAAFARAVNSLDTAAPPPLVISSLHLLAAILAQADESFAGALCAGRVEPAKLQRELVAAAGRLRLNPAEPGREGDRPASQNQPRRGGGDSVLTQFGKDLTALAREGKLRECIGREDEMLRLVRALSRETKNNPLLVGEAGVGKTAIVEGLAWRLAHGKDASLPARRVVQLHAASLLSGTTLRGQLEARVESLLAELAAEPDTLLFIDEIHQLVGGDGGGTLNVAEILKPALAGGALRCIGATTLDEYSRHIERDAALARRFLPIRIEEPTPGQAQAILETGYRQRLETKHGVRIEPAALAAAVTLSVRYLPDRRLPDKAIDLLDEACVRVTVPSLDRARPSSSDAPGIVSAETVAEVLAAWTGLPVTALDDGERARLRDMAATLQQRVYGQDEACRQVAQAVQRARAGFHNTDRPLGVLLFVGPTGVGKTELAKATANFLFGRDNALIRLDMSEYLEKHQVSRLVGAPPGYVGHEEEGQLTGALRRQPFSVVLIDEIEKAHPEVLNLFLQLFDEGRLTDARGRTARATDALFILTSNAAPPARPAMGFGNAEADENAAPAWREALQGTFRPEFINRLDAIVPFRSLGTAQLVAVTLRFLEDVRAKLGARGIGLQVSERAAACIARAGEDALSGVRGIRRVIERQIEGQVSERLVAGTLRAGDRLVIDADGNALTFTNGGGPTA